MKDFNSWNQRKKVIDQKETIFYFYEREIWWCSLGINIGFEEDGKNEQFERPVLILKKFNKEILWILPLTSKLKTNRYYYQIEYRKRRYSIILSQLRLISSKRLLRKIRTMSYLDFQRIKRIIKNFL